MLLVPEQYRIIICTKLTEQEFPLNYCSQRCFRVINITITDFCHGCCNFVFSNYGCNSLASISSVPKDLQHLNFLTGISISSGLIC